METKAKTFDAVKMACALREAASRKLETMTSEEQLAYLRKVGERHRAETSARVPSAQVPRIVK
jgi:hypothetical protein